MARPINPKRSAQEMYEAKLQAISMLQNSTSRREVQRHTRLSQKEVKKLWDNYRLFNKTPEFGCPTPSTDRLGLRPNAADSPTGLVNKVVLPTYGSTDDDAMDRRVQRLLGNLDLAIDNQQKQLENGELSPSDTTRAVAALAKLALELQQRPSSVVRTGAGKDVSKEDLIKQVKELSLRAGVKLKVDNEPEKIKVKKVRLEI